MSGQTNAQDEMECIEKQLREMVRQRWTPLRKANDEEPMDVWQAEGTVNVGHVSKAYWLVLTADVARTLSSRYFEWQRGYEENEGHNIAVTPISATDYYSVSEGPNSARDAVIKALDEVGIHVPILWDDGDRNIYLLAFETEKEAEQIKQQLGGRLEPEVDLGPDYGFKKVFVRKIADFRNYVPDDGWYEIGIHFD